MTNQISSFRHREINANGVPVGGAKLFVYEADSSTKVTVYADADLMTTLSNPVVADEGGLFSQIFLVPDDYKFVMALSTDSDPPTSPIWTSDDYAVEGQTITFDGTTLQTISGTTGVYATPNNQTGTSYTILTGDRGKLVSFSNVSAVTVTLPAANSTTFRNGWFIDLENRNSGVVTVNCSSNIDSQGSIVLSRGQGVRIFSDGATYYSQRGKPQELYSDTGGTLTIATGAITATGYSQFLVETEAAAASDDLDTINGGIDGKEIILRTVADARDVVLKHNTGNIYNPALQNITLGKTQDLAKLRYDASLTKWVVMAYQNAATAFGACAKYTYTVAANTAGGSSTASAWTVRPINTEDYDNIGITLGSNQLTIPAGIYLMNATGLTFADTSYSSRLRFQNITAGTTLALSSSDFAGNTAMELEPTIFPTLVTLTVPTVVELQYYVTVAKATTGLGVAANIGVSEIYAQIFIQKVG